ncbi:MAG: bifunctional 5,10-methylenetetrahydrofolate dehydrogenase/5,10-methenyltetrahydrofolate cyclohydrolase [bacterium]
MKIFDGKKEAEKIVSRLRDKIKKEKIKPKLAVIWVGDNKSSKVFIKKKKELAKKIKAKLAVFHFKGNAKEKDIIAKIDRLNKDFSTHGIIIQLPLPKKINTENIIKRVSLQKDVDGFHPKNRALLKKGEPYFYPVIPSIIYSILQKNSKRKIIALVNSDIFGKTLRDFLNRKNINISYFSKKSILPNFKKTDVVISIKGIPGLIRANMIKKGVVLIDGGNTLLNKKVVGDVDRKSVGNKPSFLTPVPGGLGPISVALLFDNLYLAFKKYGSR